MCGKRHRLAKSRRLHLSPILTLSLPKYPILSALVSFSWRRCPIANSIATHNTFGTSLVALFFLHSGRSDQEGENCSRSGQKEWPAHITPSAYLIVRQSRGVAISAGMLRDINFWPLRAHKLLFVISAVWALHMPFQWRRIRTSCRDIPTSIFYTTRYLYTVSWPPFAVSNM